MLLTNQKISVSFKMMEDANMTRWNKVAVPVDPNDYSKSVIWKELSELTEGDFDLIEEIFYF